MSTFNMLGGGSGMLTLNDRRRMRRPLATAPAGSVVRKPRLVAPQFTPDGGMSNNTIPAVVGSRVRVDAPDASLWDQYRPEPEPPVDINEMLDVPIVDDRRPQVVTASQASVTPAPQPSGRKLVQVVGQEDDSGIMGGPSVVYPEMRDRMGPPRPMAGPAAPVAMGYVHNPTTGENIDIVRTAPMSVSEGVDKGLVQIVPRGQESYVPSNATRRVAADMRDANENSVVNRAAADMMEKRNATRFDRWHNGPTSANSRRAGAVLDRIEQVRMGREASAQRVDEFKQTEQIKTEEMLKRPQMAGWGNNGMGWNPNAVNADGSKGDYVITGTDGKPKSIADMDEADLMKMEESVLNSGKKKEIPLAEQLEIIELRKDGKEDEAAKIESKYSELSPAQQAFIDRIHSEYNRRKGKGSSGGSAGGGDGAVKRWTPAG